MLLLTSPDLFDFKNLMVGLKLVCTKNVILNASSAQSDTEGGDDVWEKRSTCAQ